MPTLHLLKVDLRQLFNVSECQFSHLSDGNKKLIFVMSYQMAIIRMTILLFLK